MVIGAIVVTAAACSPGSSAVGGLAGTSWVVTSIGGDATIAGTEPTMAFGSDGVVRGSGGCNAYTAAYVMDAAHIHVDPLGGDLTACDPARNAQEQAFDAALGGATTWKLADDGTLQLAGAADILAAPAQGPGASAATSAVPSASSVSGLVGQTWSLVQLGSTTDLAAVMPDIRFSDDGTLSGFAGCNRFTGTFSSDGSSLDIGPIATTKMACQHPASVIESDYLNALAGVSEWSIAGGGRLLLDGAVPLTYEHR